MSASTVADSYLDSLAPAIARIDGWLAECIDAADVPENLREAARHAVLVGGKRLRPLLSVMWCEACGGNPEQARPAAVAIELIHAFSLVHDDLPALDNDLLRRGQPTVHARFGEAMAILAGDLLMSLAFETVAASGGDRAGAQPALGPVNARSGPRHGGTALDSLGAGLAFELATATTRMINGQVLDTLGGFASHEVDPHVRLKRIHSNKTGALITSACRMGARCAGAPAELLGAATEYGDAIGLMFQIVDDLLDVTQSTEHLGKAAGKDESAGKLTFPGVLGIAASQSQVRALHGKALGILEGLSGEGLGGARLASGRTAACSSCIALRELADYMAVRTR